MKRDYNFGDVLQPNRDSGFRERRSMFLTRKDDVSFVAIMLHPDPLDTHAVARVGVGATGAIYDEWWYRSWELAND